MAQICSVCRHNDFDAINRDLIAGRTSVECIASDHGLTGSSLRRHTRHHLQAEFAGAATQRAGLATGLLSHLDSILSDLSEVRDNAKLAGNGPLIVKAATSEGRLLIQIAERLSLNEQLIANHCEATAIIRAMQMVLPRHPEIANEFGDEFEKLNEPALARGVEQIVNRQRAVAS